VSGDFSIWVLCDGRPGHENQSLGLAAAILRLVPGGTVHRISVAGRGGWPAGLRAALRSAKSLPRPALVLGAGHATHPALLWLARKYQSRSVVLMKPSLPTRWFDLCIAPEHDFPGGAKLPNLILTRGAINQVRAGSVEKSGKLILIGGPSKTHGWDADGLLERLRLATDRGGWELTDSRRTPAGFLDEARRVLPGVHCIPHHETPADWVVRRLQAAKEVWVTEDSVSMIYEALTSGARVGLLPMPRLVSGSRVVRGVDSLVADGFLTPFENWLKNQRIAPPPEVLNEADRCARLVVDRMAGF
jgi:mitochondrial fission protein ELM1